MEGGDAKVEIDSNANANANANGDGDGDEDEDEEDEGMVLDVTGEDGDDISGGGLTPSSPLPRTTGRVVGSTVVEINS